MSNFVLKGDICYAEELHKVVTAKNSYLVCEDGKVAGIFEELPAQYKSFELYDYTGKLITPGFYDLHVHAPQYAFRGLGMDLELLDWLNTITFPHESKYKDVEFAKKAYKIFVDDMKNSVTARAVVFATLHVPATIALMDLFEESGLKAYVGKVNMDRNSADYLIETTEESKKATREWIEATKDRYKNVTPIITPRFIPSCTDELMRELSKIRKETGLALQSHLSENLGEISWVKELCPWADGYPDAYAQFDMLGGDCKTVMAHCVHMRDDEIDRLAKNGVFVAHSPLSNENLRSGVAPIRKMLDKGVKVGLATDLGAGSNISMLRAVEDAIQCSKLRWRLFDEADTALTMEEAFFIATKGGGEFFGKVGSFEKGYEFDAVILDDSDLLTPMELDIKQRLERCFYIAETKNVEAKFVGGVKIK